tara:strand:- start:1764 stop:3065 length:1302 start_codon:yes stop_codon:yes gene_type:complete
MVATTNRRTGYGLLPTPTVSPYPGLLAPTKDQRREAFFTGLGNVGKSMNGGYSDRPISFMNQLNKGMGGFQEGYQGELETNRAKEMQNMQAQQQQAQMQAQQMKIEQEKERKRKLAQYLNISQNPETMNPNGLSEDEALQAAFPEVYASEKLKQQFATPKAGTGAHQNAINLGLQPGTVKYNEYIRSATERNQVGPVPGRPDLYATPGGIQKIPLTADEQKKSDLAAAAAKTGGVSLTPAQKKIDETFGTDYADFVAGGGFADIEKNLGQLDGVISTLESGTDDITGPFLGNIPDSMKATVAPAATKVQDAVEEVVQRNLRLILGAQFTEKEGVRLIARAFNPRLEEAENAKRVRRLKSSIDKAFRAKMAAAQYYEKNGSLKGYKGVKSFTLRDIENDAFEEDRLAGVGKKRPDDVNEALWNEMTPEERKAWQ